MAVQSEISSLKKGDKIDQFFILKRSEVRITKTNRNYLWLEFADRNFTLTCNVWENFDTIVKNFLPGELIKVEGILDEYMGAFQVKLISMRHTNESDNVSFADFLSKSKYDPAKMRDEFIRRINSISDSYLRKLMQLIFNEENLDRFSTAPAGKAWHHSYIHGLIEHTLEIIRICDLMCDLHPEINRDLLVSGAMMHDFGKIEELKYDSSFEYTDKGKLIGHIVLSAIIIHDYTAKIPGFPEEIKNCLTHLVLSHQGKLEFASPVVPKTIEAITLYQADELSAKTNAYKNAVYSDMKNDLRWTKYLSIISTDLYKYSSSPESSEEKLNETLFD